MPKKQLKAPATTRSRTNKVAVAQDDGLPIESVAAYPCSCCGYKYRRQEGNFNASKSPLYAGNNGYMTLCKKCVSELYEKYLDFYKQDEDLAMERICQVTDMYFDDTAWQASRKNNPGKSRFSIYVSKLNLAQSSAGRTYSDSIIHRSEVAEQERRAEEARLADEAAVRAAEAERKALEDAERFSAEVKRRAEIEAAKIIEATKQEEEARRAEEEANTPTKSGVSRQVIRRFGEGFSEREYDMLQTEYDSWKKEYGIPIDKRQDELYVTICYMKLNFQKSIQGDGNGIGALANSYRSVLEAATTEIEDRKKKAEADQELPPIGMLYRDIEQHTPAEFYKDKHLYEDFDQLKEYFMRYMVRPLRNLLTGSKEKDGEFILSDTEQS